ncbi:alginate lyase family protein [Coraliomargarita sp. SDUM461004]|uniref:Alginate lyase family protein n=1 Tax=Thalassobacterium sedimentorum TaxID=3041258 RepID=A0ABU1AGQ6_9BACT|nr:alginate lyase family protein [Coraliomargarita sp. SDUM461004]MDQ8192803.1 alginate lyase family protein [Coraliomargarita sp. SDUM461004]
MHMLNIGMHASRVLNNPVFWNSIYDMICKFPQRSKLLLFLALASIFTYSARALDTRSIQAIGEMLPIEHPSLFITQDEADQILEQAEADENYQQALDAGILKNAIIAYADLGPDSLEIPRKESTHPHHKIILDMQHLAVASLFTQNPAYVERLTQVMLEYASFYETITPKRGSAGRLTAQSLNEAMVMVQLAWIYDIIYPALSKEQREQIENHLLRPGAELLMGQDRGRSNWQTWHNAALASLGLVLSDHNYLNHAINGPSGFLYQLSNSINKDGLSYELSISYHDYAMHAVTLLALACDRAGIDLFNQEDGKLESFYAAPIYYAYSNLKQAPFHDAHPTARLNIGVTSWNYPYAWEQYQTPAFRWLWKLHNSVEKRAKSEKRIPPLIAQSVLDFSSQPQPEVEIDSFTVGTDLLFDSNLRNVLGSTLFVDTGIAILRGPAGEISPEMSMLWKPNGTEAGHQHPNNLAIDWQSPSYRWLSASGKWVGYSSQMHKQWVQQTLSDNTLVVDGKSQKPGGDGVPNWKYDEPNETSAGKLRTFTNSTSFGYVDAETENVYPGVQLNRQIIHTQNYSLDLFHAESQEEHTYDWSLNISGSLRSATTEFQQEADAFADRGVAYKYLWDTQVAQLNKSTTTYWIDPDTVETFAVTTLPQTGTTMYLSTSPWKDRDRSSLIVSNKTKHAEFLNIWRAYEDNDPIKEIMQPGHGITAMITLSSGLVDVIALGREKTVKGPIGGIESYNAHSLLARMSHSGDPRDITLVEGTRLSLGTISLKLDSPANWSFNRINNDSYLFIYDSAEERQLSIQSEKKWILKQLDANGSIVKIIDPDISNIWKVRPFTNYLLTRENDDTTKLPALTKTFRLN